MQLLAGLPATTPLVFTPPNIPYDGDYLFDASGDNVLAGASAVTTVSFECLCAAVAPHGRTLAVYLQFLVRLWDIDMFWLGKWKQAAY